MKNFRIPALNRQPNQRKPLFALMCFLLAILAGVGHAVAQDAAFGASAAPSCSQAGNPATDAPPLINLGNVYPYVTYGGAQYGTAGTPLRNRRTGAIRLSGVIPPVQAAFIYWAVITQGPPPAPIGRIQVQRLAPPAPASANPTLTGVIVGQGVVPCPWIGDRITVYRALIPTAVATGNGTYKVTMTAAGAGGLVGGEDPWAAPQALPLWEGASIVMVGTGPVNQVVSIFDVGLAGNTFNADGGLGYQLVLPSPALPNSLLLFDEIGADGQHGQGRAADPAVSAETTFLNGVPIAGPGSDYNDSDWNGGAGLPLPELWDDSGHHFSVPVATATLPVGITNGAFGFGDCLTPVANVIQQQVP